jgi:hypothetical protein
MLKKFASSKKVEIQAMVEKKRVSSSLNFDLDLSLSQKLRPCLGQGASRRAGVGRVRSQAFLSILLSHRKSREVTIVL